MPITPDTKDWTWVLTRPCAECGFDSSTMAREQIGPRIRTNAEAWPPILSEPPGRLRRRPRDDRWSPLEYACHVRDVYRLFDERLQLMLALDDPLFPNWDQDRAAVDARYGEQDPSTVAARLLSAGRELAERFEGIEATGWERRGTRSDGARFTVDTFGRYLLHDPVHHLHDVTADLAARRWPGEGPQPRR